jgi:hypothetical protein
MMNKRSTPTDSALIEEGDAMVEFVFIVFRWRRI